MHYFDVDAVIIFEKVMELLLLDNFLRDVTESHVDEFRAFDRSGEVEISNVNSHEMIIMDMMLLKRTLVMIISAVSVATAPW